jgi:hypothetical protein
MSLIPDAGLVSDEAIVNYKRWIAMAFVGGGWLADYHVWPLNYFLQNGRVLPHDGAITIYMGTNPVLVSGTGDEFLRMAQQIGQTADKMIGHQKWLNENYPEQYKKNVPWNDSIALVDLRKNVSKDMFKSRGDVVERSRVLGKSGVVDCDASAGKRAVYFRGLSGTNDANRGTVARKFLNQWRAACGVTQATELVVSKK